MYRESIFLAVLQPWRARQFQHSSFFLAVLQPWRARQFQDSSFSPLVRIVQNTIKRMKPTH